MEGWKWKGLATGELGEIGGVRRVGSGGGWPPLAATAARPGRGVSVDWIYGDTRGQIGLCGGFGAWERGWIRAGQSGWHAATGWCSSMSNGCRMWSVCLDDRV